MGDKRIASGGCSSGVPVAEREPYVARDALEEEDDARDARFAHL